MTTKLKVIALTGVLLVAGCRKSMYPPPLIYPNVTASDYGDGWYRPNNFSSGSFICNNSVVPSAYYNSNPKELLPFR